jgi:NAD(P)H-nitrite reductase large subunit
VAQRQRHAVRAAARHHRFQDALADVYRAPHLTDELAEPETQVCRCEGVTRQAIDRALAAGAGHIGTVKRETRAGMGPCQGRYCGPLIAAMVARSTGEQPGELSGFAPSPPVRPVEVGALIGITD